MSGKDAANDAEARAKQHAAGGNIGAYTPLQHGAGGDLPRDVFEAFTVSLADRERRMIALSTATPRGDK